MNYLNIVLVFLVLFSQVAVSEDAPAYMKDGVIQVTLKDGKTYSFSLNDWKVVPRHGEPEVVPVPESRSTVDRADDKPNRVTLYGGIGPNGLNVVTAPGLATVSQSHGAVFGGSYSRKVDDRFSVSGAAFSNSTFALGIGYDF